MKVKIISSKHKKNKPDIFSLIGQEFEAEATNGVTYIISGKYSGVYLKDGEYEILT
jgi:hypothetical protein